MTLSKAAKLEEGDVKAVPRRVDDLVVDGNVLAVWMWPGRPTERGVCVTYHGYPSHSNCPCLKYTNEVFAGCGLRCYTADLPGFGASPGTPALIPSQTFLVDVAVAIARHVRGLHPELPFFICGHSLGGCIAMAASKQVPCTGGIWLSPMIRQSPDNVPPAAVVWILRRIASWLPWLPAITVNASDPELSYGDPERRAASVEYEDSGCQYAGRMRLATGVSLLDLSLLEEESLCRIRCPFLVHMGAEDVIVDPAGADELVRRCATPPELWRYHKYEGGLHVLVGAEEPLRSQVVQDIHVWVDERLSAS